jgi:hypothetical protein
LIDEAMEREYNNRAKVPDFPAIAAATRNRPKRPSRN